MNQQNSWLDGKEVRARIEALARNGYNAREIADMISEDFDIPTSDRSIRRAFARWERQDSTQSSVEVEDDEATITEEPVRNTVPQLGDADAFIREHGLKPEEWHVENIKVNKWDSPTGDTLYQLSVNLRRKQGSAVLIAPRTDGWKAPKNFRKSTGGSKLVVFTGDQQAPFHDPHLHELFCAWLKENQPHEGVLIGDTVDFPDISRHRWNPENTATVNECLQAGYDILRGYVESSTQTRWQKLPGNHDERLRNSIIDRVPELHGVRRASAAGEESPVLSVDHLLRLDELGIEYVDPQGEYAQGQIRISKNLAARHGWIAKKGSGSSALATLEHLGFSVIIGHTHRQSLVYKTTHDIDGNATTLAAAETGCMCRIDGLGYAVSPDWQQGFATATIWDDGKFRIDHATYVNNVLVWRDQRFG